MREFVEVVSTTPDPVIPALQHISNEVPTAMT